MRYRVFATDYDGTIATHGSVDDDTQAALEQVARSGRKLLLVTGRELESLLEVYPGHTVFDWLVLENGALLYRPSTREEHALGPPPSPELIARLKERGVEPLSIGRVIVATWEPHERVVLETIHELGLELQVIFNKGAVMILPSGMNKRTGLEAALQKLRLSAHNAVGIGDAENDHAFLSTCECSVAVANALPALQQEADWVAERDHGRGVQDLISRLLQDDLVTLEPQLTRHHVQLGSTDAGTEYAICPYGRVVLVAGSSGSGKSTAATSLLERLSERSYQICIVDPEGDYGAFESAVTTGSTDHAPDLEHVTQILERADTHAVVNLLGVPTGDRPALFIKLLTRLQGLRGSFSRPHWIVVDEAHHVLGSQYEPVRLALPNQLGSLLLITVHPDSLERSVLERVDLLLAAGPEAQQTIATFAQARSLAIPEMPDTPVNPGQALIWDPREGPPRRITLIPARGRHQRHRRKYARGELGPDKSFYFRGPEDRLNLRAQNLAMFNQIGAGVDEATWSFHLKQQGYSRWVRESIKDDELAQQIAQVERNLSLTPRESREAIRSLIEEKYTLPA
ncbi:MAG TPA: HAD hydrolase family protein [Polyangiaceae bacterium]